MLAIEREIVRAPLAATAIFSVGVPWLVSSLVALSYKQEILQARTEANIAIHNAETTQRMFDVVFMSDFERYRTEIKTAAQKMMLSSQLGNSNSEGVVKPSS